MPYAYCVSLEYGRGSDGSCGDCEVSEKDLVAYLGANPQAGEVIPETAGVRKIRWALGGRGMNEKGNLTMAEHNVLKRLIPLLVTGYPAETKESR